MAKVRIDASAHPLVRIDFPARGTLDDIDRYLEELMAVRRERGPFAVVTDLSAISPAHATPKQRKRLADGVDEVAKDGGIIAEGLVVTSVALRAMVTAYTWLRSKKSHPIQVFSSVDAAQAWVEEQLRRRASPK